MSQGAGILTDLKKIIDNITLLFFKLSILGGYVIYSIIDGFVDEYEDESGISAKINQTYDAINNLYYPTVSPPAITQSQLGISANDAITWGAGLRGIFQGFKIITIFDVTRFIFSLYCNAGATGTLTGYIYSDDGAGSPLAQLAVFSAVNVNTLDTSGAGADVSFTGNYIPTIGIAYHIIVIWTGGTAGDTINMKTNAAGGYADGICGCNNGAGWVVLAGKDAYFKIYQTAYYLNMTSTSIAVVALSAPNTARIILLEEDIDVIAQNTDLLAYASRDNGATWEQCILADEGFYAPGKRLLSSGLVSLAAQPAGTNMKYKIMTLNNKGLKLEGVSLQWA